MSAINMCRLCPNATNLLHIFDEKVLSVNKNVKEVIFVTTGVEIKTDDVVPQKICQKCFTLIQDMFQFRQQALRHDKVLKGLLEEMERYNAKKKKRRIENSESKSPVLSDSQVTNLPSNIHPSIVDLFRENPKLKLPKICLKSNMQPFVDMQMTVETQPKPQTESTTTDVTQPITVDFSKPQVSSTTNIITTQRQTARKRTAYITQSKRVPHSRPKVTSTTNTTKPNIANNTVCQISSTTNTQPNVTNNAIGQIRSGSITTKMVTPEVANGQAACQVTSTATLTQPIVVKDKKQITNTPNIPKPKATHDPKAANTTNKRKSKSEATSVKYFIPKGVGLSSDTNNNKDMDKNIKTIPRLIIRKKECSDIKKKCKPRESRKRKYAPIDNGLHGYEDQKFYRCEDQKPAFIRALELVPNPSGNPPKPKKDSALIISYEKSTLLYICNVCDSVHSTPRELKKHQNKHLKCQFCKKRFKNILLKNTHVANRCIKKISMDNLPDVEVERIEDNPEMRQKYAKAFAEFSSHSYIQPSGVELTQPSLGYYKEAGRRKETSISLGDFIEILSDDEDKKVILPNTSFKFNPISSVGSSQIDRKRYVRLRRRQLQYCNIKRESC